MPNGFLHYIRNLFRKWWLNVAAVFAFATGVLGLLPTYLPPVLRPFAQNAWWLLIPVFLITFVVASYEVHKDGLSRTANFNRLPGGFVLFINGGSGVGKTTIAARLAWEYGVTSVVGTDLIREALRFDAKRNPTDETDILMVSSFLAHKKLASLKGSFKERVVSGFRKQSSLLSGSMIMIADRISFKKTPAILEGINLMASQILGGPGHLPNDSHCSLLFINLYINSNSEHRRRLWQRGADAPGLENRTQEYVQHLEEIRAIDTCLKDDAKKVAGQTVGDSASVISIDNSGPIDATISAIKKRIAEKVDHLRKNDILGLNNGIGQE